MSTSPMSPEAWLRGPVEDAQVDRALNQQRAMQLHTITDARVVGRKPLPSTVHGLLFHAAEHVQRHVGQLLVTARVLQQVG